MLCQNYFSHHLTVLPFLRTIAVASKLQYHCVSLEVSLEHLSLVPKEHSEAISYLAKLQ